MGNTLTPPPLIIGRMYYDSILKGIIYLGENSNEHTFKHKFTNDKGNQILLSDFETLPLLTLNAIN